MTKRSIWPLFSSILLVVSGIVCILIPWVSKSIIGTLFIGRMLLFCGFVHTLRLFATRDTWTVVRRIPPVVVPVLIGLLILLNEGPRARSVTVMLMIFFVLDGFFKIVSSMESNPARLSHLGLASAALSLFLAIFLAATFPNASLQLLALFLGLDLISMGLLRPPELRVLPRAYRQARRRFFGGLD
jgi:uncharacterized membrane protein HdeD (DUF308 family)